METAFLKILNMGITASWVAVAVLTVRFLLRRAPKWIMVLMWGMVGLRLICPVSLNSIFSLIPSAETVPGNILYTDTPTIHSGVETLNSIVNPIISESMTPMPGASVNPMQPVVFGASIVWIVGIAFMLVYAVTSFVRIHMRVREAVPLEENIWICDYVDTPFILGVIFPRIYLPSEMREQDLKYVIAHEKAHLKRRDHWWKPLGFLLLAIYWFHPILWIAYILLCRDIELACDEKVIRNMGIEHKKPYSNALINCSVTHKTIAVCPLAFGEVSVKGRVKSVLNYKKPAFWIIVISVITCVIVAVCFLTNPETAIDERLSVFLDCEIASRHQSEESKNNFCCLDWEVLGKETNGNQTTVYMWVLYGEFRNENGLGLQNTAGAHILTAVTAEKKDGNYQLIEYWEPEDGSEYENSIMKKIPVSLWGKAMDSQKYYGEQSDKLKQMAARYFELTINESGETNETVDVKTLRETYPQYFDLDASNGLDVYVWQLSEKSYYFGLLPHTATERDFLDYELLDLKGISRYEMRQILSTYHIDKKDIYIVPWMNPISSYIRQYWGTFDGEDNEEKLENYKRFVRSALLYGE